jgi:hypothetical protein
MDAGIAVLDPTDMHVAPRKIDIRPARRADL